MLTIELKTAKDYVLRGETYRIRGHFSSAIQCFDEALKKKPSAYGFAHRGAAWSEMLQLARANEDFDEAERLYAAQNDGKKYPWVIGRRAEAERLYARALMAYAGGVDPDIPLPPWIQESDVKSGGNFWPHLHAAIKGFDEAAKACGGNAWIWAHKGAALTHAYVGLSNIDGVPEAVKLAVALDAHAAFDQALVTNSAYCWAMAFKGYLYALEAKWDECDTWIRTAKMFDTQGTIVVLRSVAETKSFRKLYPESVDLAWEATRDTREDFGATYLAAVGLSLDDATKATLGQPSRDVARDLLLAIQSRISVYLGGLNAMELDTLASDDPRRAPLELEIRELLGSLSQHRDAESIAMLRRDPAWDSWRDKEVFKGVFKMPEVPAHDKKIFGL